MKITLRNGARIQKLIDKAILKIDLSDRITVPILSIAINDSIETARKKLKDSFATANELERIRSIIRVAIDEQQAAHDIGSLLTERATVIRQRDRAQALAASRPFNEDLIKTRQELAKRRLEGSESRYRADTDEITVDFLPQTDIEEFRKLAVQLERRLTQIDDKLDHLNRANEITIADKDKAILENCGII